MFSGLILNHEMPSVANEGNLTKPCAKNVCCSNLVEYFGTWTALLKFGSLVSHKCRQ